MKYSIVLSLIVFLSSCANYQALNKKEHEFAATPNQVVLIQVPGLDEQHLAVLKFASNLANQKTALGNSLCFGKAWNYNLYSIRPKASSGLLAQITGKKNIKGDCSDYTQDTLWNQLSANGFQNAILEKPYRNKTAYVEAKQCNKDYLKNVVTWTMQAPGKDDSRFHAEEKRDYLSDTVYYDKSCGRSSCYSSLYGNAVNFMKTHFENSGKFFFLIQNYRLLEALESKNLNAFKDALLEVEKIYEYFLSLRAKYPEMLVVLTGTQARPIEFPNAGKDWTFEKRMQKSLVYKKSQLLSPVFATGPRAENFCGIYEEAEIMGRVLQKFKVRKFDLLFPIF